MRSYFRVRTDESNVNYPAFVVDFYYHSIAIALDPKDGTTLTNYTCSAVKFYQFGRCVPNFLTHPIVPGF